MPTTLTPAVTAANALTARWLDTASAEQNVVLSGAGVWPLLALLTDAADEPARSELLTAVDHIADPLNQAVELIDILDGAQALSAALGLWVRPQLPLNPEWTAALPAGVLDTLGDQDRLDAWAETHTRGLIPRFPLAVGPDDALVLATALAAMTRWRAPFEPARLHPRTGPWSGRNLEALTRSSTNLSELSVLDAPSPVTRLVVAGEDDLDVHLLLGGSDPGALIDVGLRALTGAMTATDGARLPIGATAPGVVVAQAAGSTDSLSVSLPPFLIRSSHDLCRQAQLFGLHTATDPSSGHFPRISPTPLAVGRGAQDVMAQFSAEGFKAAAVTAFAVRVAAAFPLHRNRVKTISVTLDQPFAFMAVHRPTALVVVVGWVADPVGS
ncbi:hypothetical protein FOS14_20180 [Skermania sp. ID1734]|uniref:serpin family protein n=1 Tax=Skermania sp. ID1734 TaxID=2597516 RepID=UPI00117C9659|nr:serpin family protein [Skermania sp. ID1734]TSD94628.1 hypothetical protein FOS14_20180 [Skermania sp. ID1734]